MGSNLIIRKETYTNHYLPLYVLNFSKAITKILTAKFNIDFRIKQECLKSFCRERKLLVAIVRAFLIDEGCIRTEILTLFWECELLEDLKQICLLLDYKCQNIRKSGGTYYLNISQTHLPKFMGFDLFGKLPIADKQERLVRIKIINNSPDFHSLDNDLLLNLKSPITTLELSKRL